MTLKAFLTSTLYCTVILIAPDTVAWGGAGHRIVGEVALEYLDEKARISVAEILASKSSTVGEACNWPDVVRETSEWEWSAPLHYVNIPRKAAHDVRQGDCCD